MYVLKRILIMLSCCLMAACGSQTPKDNTDQPSESIRADKPMLPAHPMPGERNGAGKGDQYDDYRLANPNIFGITAAPQTPLRAVGQWDDHQSMLLTWNKVFPETYAGIVANSKNAIQIYVVHEGNADKQHFNATMSSFGVSTAGLKYLNMANNSIWMRDYGPLSARAPDGTVAFIDPRYYHQRVYDDALPTLIGNEFGINVYRQPLQWEGGTYIADGLGNCIYSQGVYWYGGTSQAKIHKYQKDYLGCQTNIVVKPLVGEGTTHSDMFAKMYAPGKVMLGEYKSWQDSTNKATMDDDEAILEAAILNDGSTLSVTRLPMPSNSNKQVWRTYVNSLFTNGVNLVPIYTDDTTFQAEALAVWEDAMPSWTHAAIDSTGLIQWSGAIHCITMTVPTGPLDKVESNPSLLCSGDFNCFPSGTGGGSCDLGYEGCCDGANLQTCGSNGITTQSCGGAGCGWSDDTLSYACGGSGAGPLANAPLQCDGGGCEPNCTNKECGSNGCGGSCGTCSGNASCVGGECVIPTDPCQGIDVIGCCDGATLKFCQQGQMSNQSCGANGCGWNASGGDSGWYDCGGEGADPSGAYPLACPGTGTPDCAGKMCGDDGCGGSCGGCDIGLACDAGQCVSNCTADCAGKQCGSDGCGGSCGSCAQGKVCDPQQKCVSVCQPNCTNKTCGPDGCGGSCGSCAAGENCAAGQCEAVAGCGDVTFEGKCDGDTLIWCQEEELLTYDCKQLGNYKCAKKEGSDEFDCVVQAGCTADCDGKACGPDGCGGVCGACEAGSSCNDVGQCIAADGCEGLTYEGCCQADNTVLWCENNAKQALQCGEGGCGWNDAGGYYDCNQSGDGPAEFPKQCNVDCDNSCEGKECGLNDCGNTCGVCTGGLSCEANKCIDACGDISIEGVCEGDSLTYCANGQKQTFPCSDGCCGWNPEQFWYDCLPTEQCTGGDGCATGETGCSQDGFHSWTCTEQDGNLLPKYTKCASGECDPATGKCTGEPPPVCDCTGKVCGPDGCGGSCGDCAAGLNCNASGQCVGCAPSCDGKVCGDDGCGGSCGSCEDGLSCKEGQCVQTSDQPKCDDKECGDDGFGGYCGDCPTGLVCDKVNKCVEPPPIDVPDCENKECGPDGIGGSCGACAKEQECKSGVCEDKPNAGCGGVPTTGQCDGDVLKFCGDDGAVSEVNCAAQGLVCAAKAGQGFDCVEKGACEPKCDPGQQCGDDGCGGSCGNCSKNDKCVDGQCVSDSCVPSCAATNPCGSDGCGGLCGTCAPGQSCDSGQCIDAELCPDGSAPVDGICVGGTDGTDLGGTDDGGGSGGSGSKTKGDKDDGGCAVAARGTDHNPPAGSTLMLLLLAAMTMFLKRRTLHG